MAPIPQSELKRWHQCLVFRCLLCIQPNLGHVPAPPIISSLAAVRWQSQHGGVGAAALYFWACAAGEHGYKIPATLHLAAGEVAPWELKDMKCKREEGVYFQHHIPNRSNGCEQTFHQSLLGHWHASLAASKCVIAFHLGSLGTLWGRA